MILIFFNNGFSGEPIWIYPPFNTNTLWELNSNPSTSSNINLPSTITVFKIGVDISNKIFYPAGILTTFPSVGGLPPPHVVYYDHLSIYK